MTEKEYINMHYKNPSMERIINK